MKIIVTIKDIAKVANVSIATVSNSLNDTGWVSDTVKAQVKKIASDMGYIPNVIATSLKKGKLNTIGVISEDITCFNMPDIIDGISEYAENAGYSLLLANLRYLKKTSSKGEDYSESLHKYIDQITKLGNSLLNNTEGIIYIGSTEWETKAFIKNTNKPIVYTYSHIMDTLPNQFSVYYDDENASYQAVKYLISQGHKNIGLITGPLHWVSVQNRLKGYQLALKETGIKFNPDYVRTGRFCTEDGLKYGRELLETSNSLTAIYCMNDEIAIGVLYSALDMGYKIPKDISIIGTDDIRESSIIRPELSTMRLPLREMGIESGRLLIDMIENKVDESKLQDVKLQCKLISRESTRRI
ncbi:MAG: LacI family transcriptional regulator [Firmicutes bacterium]|nr:LacI family transcriptional regulator [Bacillota bacterium]